MIISGHIIDIPNRDIFPGEIELRAGKILKIRRLEEAAPGFLLPGFIDAHVHIESSMLVPSEFARLALPHGTVATVSDPHEIGNVMGIEGVEFMIENGKQVPLKFYFGAPSCVPATRFETAGAEIGPEGIERLLANPDIVYLAEMMNYPGVIYDDPMVQEKLAIAQRHGKPIDGHAPGLRGKDLEKYISAGISTDHECYALDEAREKLGLGMKVLIREGSAAKNFETLIPLLPEYYTNLMFCSDDKHPDDLILGHINQLVKRALARGMDLFQVLQVACLNPIDHYGLAVGQLQEGDPADFIRISDLESFEVLETWIDGAKVAENGHTDVPSVRVEPINHFEIGPITREALRLPSSASQLRVIKAIDGELITEEEILPAHIEQGCLVSDVREDVLKLVMINRYRSAKASIAFIKNFGLKSGALASCVGHDSHNILAVGVDDEAICRAINLIISEKGGISAVSEGQEKILSLPVAGIMSHQDGQAVGKAYADIDKMAHEMGSQLSAPFMTLSFMGLLVIPALKLSDLGLFDGQNFSFVDLEA